MVLLNDNTPELLSESKYEWRQDVWIKEVHSGKHSKNTDIAVKVFGMTPPTKEMFYINTYPFMTIDTLLTWLDWEFYVQVQKYPSPACLQQIMYGMDGSEWTKNCPAESITFSPGPSKAKMKIPTILEGDTIFVKTDFIPW